MSTRPMQRTLSEEIEELKACPHFVWWILAFTGCIGSNTKSFLSRNKALELLEQDYSRLNEEHLTPEKIVLIKILAGLFEEGGKDTLRLKLSELCGRFKRDAPRTARITSRKAGALLKSLDVRTLKGSKGYTYVILDNAAMDSLKEKAASTQNSSLREERKQMRDRNKALRNRWITSNVFMQAPMLRNPDHRPTDYPKYEAIHYLRAYFRKCSGRSRMITIERILKAASAIEAVKEKLERGEVVSRTFRPRTAGYKSLQFQLIAECCCETGIDRAKFRKVFGAVEEELVDAIDTERSSSPDVSNDWNIRRPDSIRHGIDHRGNPLWTLDQHLAFYERHYEKIDEALMTGKPLSSLWSK